MTPCRHGIAICERCRARDDAAREVVEKVRPVVAVLEEGFRRWGFAVTHPDAAELIVALRRYDEAAL